MSKLDIKDYRGSQNNIIFTRMVDRVFDALGYGPSESSAEEDEWVQDMGRMMDAPPDVLYHCGDGTPILVNVCLRQDHLPALNRVVANGSHRIPPSPVGDFIYVITDGWDYRFYWGSGNIFTLVASYTLDADLDVLFEFRFSEFNREAVVQEAARNSVQEYLSNVRSVLVNTFGLGGPEVSDEFMAIIEGQIRMNPPQVDNLKKLVYEAILDVIRSGGGGVVAPPRPAPPDLAIVGEGLSLQQTLMQNLEDYLVNDLVQLMRKVINDARVQSHVTVRKTLSYTVVEVNGEWVARFRATPGNKTSGINVTIPVIQKRGGEANLPELPASLNHIRDSKNFVVFCVRSEDDHREIREKLYDWSYRSILPSMFKT